MHATTASTTPSTDPIEGPAPRDALLDRLLDDELGFSPLAAHHGFISHLAMSLVAARRLGADDEQLQRWYDRQTSGSFLVPRARPDWLGAATEEVARAGTEAATAAALPDLVDDPGSQFFHAVIRLELALDADHPGQVANSLHNWSTHRRPWEPAPEPTGDRSLRAVLEDLGDDMAAGRLDPSDPHALVASTAFRSRLDQLGSDDDGELLDQLAQVAAAAHVGAPGFGTLHLVTGTRSVRRMAAVTDETARRSLVLHAVQAVAATWLGIGAPTLATEAELDRRRAATPSDPTTVAQLAVASGDPHVVKLVYACQLELDETGDPIYRWLAAAQTGAER